MKKASERWSLPLAALLLVARPAGAELDLARFERERVLRLADAYLAQEPVTVTASSSPRSPGGPHDYFSEGDYWWPDPENPGGPYVRRDGQSNPDNFDDHRRAMRRLSLQVPALAAAWRITGDPGYAEHAVKHLLAWFVQPATRMNPHLRYAQAVHGHNTGRSIGIIDTIHLIEVARAIEVLAPSGAFADRQLDDVIRWFKDYVHWLVTHPYGLQERDAHNNHGTCWVAQVAAFARLTQDEPLLEMCRARFEDVLLDQMTGNGSFPLELTRTKPYGYSLFNLDAFAVVAQLLSTTGDDLWRLESRNRGLRAAVAFMFPFVKDKGRWPLVPDVQHHDEWPMRHPALLFAGLAYDEPEYIEVWKTLPADSAVEEVVRNFFIRQPVLWVDDH